MLPWVSGFEVCAAIKDVFEDTRAILEPAGALAIAGAKAYVAQAAAGRHRLQGETLIAVAWPLLDTCARM